LIATSSIEAWRGNRRETATWTTGKVNVMTPVTHFNLEITNLCNQRCLYCFNNSGAVERKGELPIESWERFLKRQAEQGLKSVHITGGEPFVN
jgi:molybdenum cofactor biosynthesis enzyme MoaA